jgi:hypothetical protein
VDKENFKSELLHNLYFSPESIIIGDKQDEMGGTCSMHLRDEIRTKLLSGNMKGRWPLRRYTCS